MPSQLNSIAVLIDADNASAKNIGMILDEISKLGHISCKKIYGDWSNVHIQSWQEALLTHAIDPMQQFAYVKGKNATDIAMVIEAMDLLHSGDYDGFCLISSDSDFTSLAIRIRKSNFKVFGFGKRNTVNAFTQACDGFFYVEDLVNASIKNNSNPKPSDDKLAQSKQTNERWGTRQLLTQSHLTGVINKLIKEDPRQVEGWSDISYVARAINEDYPHIKLDKYGYSKFSELIKAMRLYDIKRDKSQVLIKLKTKNKKITSSKRKNIENTQQAVKPSGSDSSLYIDSTPIVIELILSPLIDAVLYRLTDKDKVRGDEDMIFYGQTHSEDNTIEMSQQEEEQHSFVAFRCDLGAQPSDINQMIVILSTELDALQSHTDQTSVRLNIASDAKDEKEESNLFSGVFDIHQKTGKSLLLLTLVRDKLKWQIKPTHKSINGDLAELCHIYGIEISDD